MADTPLTIVGAGVVGLATPARLAKRFPELVILERRERHGSETSSRNSEVIHGGMYYPAGSLKARLCVRGRELLYELCERAAIPHRRIGKLIVAMRKEEEPELERLLALGKAERRRRSRMLGRRGVPAGSSRRCQRSPASTRPRPAS